MKAHTIEQAREICRRNANGKTGERDPNKPIEWTRETMNSLVSDCGRYRLTRRHSPEDDCLGWFLMLTSPPRHLCGPFLIPKDARDAAQRHAQGLPLQADLA